MKKYINLLPPQDQNQIRLSGLENELLNLGSWVILSLLVVASLLFSAQTFLRSELQVSSERVAITASALTNLESKAMRAEVELFNQDLANFQVISRNPQSLSRALIEFAKILPSDVALDSLVITMDQQKVEAKGRAGTRESVLQLRKNILASPYFVNVNFPLSNLEKPKDLPWKYRFYLRPEAFK